MADPTPTREKAEALHIDPTPAEVEAVRAGCAAITGDCPYWQHGRKGCTHTDKPCLYATAMLTALRHPTPARPAPPESEVEAVTRVLQDEPCLSVGEIAIITRKIVAALDKARAARGVITVDQLLAILAGEADGEPERIIRRVLARWEPRDRGRVGDEPGGSEPWAR